MIIRYIEIENFRPFFNTQKIEFSDGINIVNAQQGGGKTSLFSAFYWCLFDKIYNSTDKEWIESPNFDSVLNKQAFEISVTKKEVCTVVKLSIEKKNSEGKSETYLITRKISGKKSSDGELIDTQKDLEVSFYDEQGSNSITGREASTFIDQFIFPESLSDYIWFQGEFLNRLINLDSSDSFKKVIDTISYIDHYDNLLSLLETSYAKNHNTKKKKLNQSNQKQKDENNLTSSITFAQRSIKELEEKILPELEYQITVLEEEAENLTKKITSNDRSKDLLTSIKNINDSYKTQIKERESIDRLYREKLGSKWMIKGLEDHIQNATIKMHEFERSYAKALNDVHELPINTPDDNTLRDMLKAKKCLVCDTPAPEGSNQYKNIEAKIGRALDSTKKLDPESTSIYNAIKAISRVPEDLIISIGEINDEINELDDREDAIATEINLLKNDLDKKLDEKHKVEKDLGVSNLEDFSSNIEKNTNSLIATQKALAQKNNERDRIKNSIVEKKNSLKVLNTKLNSLIQEKGGDTIEIEIEKILEILMESVKRTKNVEYSKLVVDIQNKTNELLLRALEGNDSVKVQIQISPSNNEINRLDLSGKNLDLELNTGHDSLINLCLIMAIISKSNSYSNQAFTFLSDAPTSNLDPNVSLDWTYLNKEVFEQSIIMNKDLINFEAELLKSDKIASLYRLETTAIDNNSNVVGIENQYSKVLKIK